MISGFSLCLLQHGHCILPKAFHWRVRPCVRGWPRRGGWAGTGSPPRGQRSEAPSPHARRRHRHHHISILQCSQKNKTKQNETKQQPQPHARAHTQTRRRLLRRDVHPAPSGEPVHGTSLPLPRVPGPLPAWPTLCNIDANENYSCPRGPPGRTLPSLKMKGPSFFASPHWRAASYNRRSLYSQRHIQKYYT